MYMYGMENERDPLRDRESIYQKTVLYSQRPVAEGQTDRQTVKQMEQMSNNLGPCVWP